MPNYYTQFSFAITDLTDEEEAWFLALAAVDPDDDDPDEPVGLAKYADEISVYPGFSAEVQAEADGKILWVYAEESGTPEDAAAFVQDFLAAHRPDQRVGFEWANTCHRPVIDAFGGGACLVTADGATWMASGRWLAEQTRAAS